jgi:hypothetical protein
MTAGSGSGVRAITMGFLLQASALSTVLMAGAVFALARSPLLAEENQPRGSSRSGRQSPGKPAHATS